MKIGHDYETLTFPRTVRPVMDPSAHVLLAVTNNSDIRIPYFIDPSVLATTVYTEFEAVTSVFDSNIGALSIIGPEKLDIMRE